MRLPASRFHQLFGGDAAGPLQQVQDSGGFAAFAGDFRLDGLGVGLGGLCGRAALGRFLRREWPSPALVLTGVTGRATWRTAGLLVGFRPGASGNGRGGTGFFCGQRGHFASPSAVITAVTNMDHSGWPEMQGNSERSRTRRWNGDASTQMTAGDRR